MVKGVNKNIIEISETGNDCFERVILFVRPESMEQGSEHLLKKAKLYIRGLRMRPVVLGRKARWALAVAKLGAAATVGGLIATLLLKM